MATELTDMDGDIMAEQVAESMEHLEAIEPDLLILEKGGEAADSELINRIC